MALEMAVLAAGLLIAASILFYTLKTGTPPMPTAPKVKSVLLSMTPEDVAGTVFEIGSGWGTLAFSLARRYPDNRVAGLEVSPVPWLVSRLWLRLHPHANLELHWTDAMKTNLSGAGLVVCYLNPGGMEKLAAKLAAELRPGAYVLSNTFALSGWQPLRTSETSDLYASKVYLYRKP